MTTRANNEPRPRQTTANNAFLAGVKRLMNGKIYKHALMLVNYDGEAAAVEYLQQFFRRPVSVAFFTGEQPK